MSAFPCPVPPRLPESLPEGYGHSRGSFNCFLGTLLLFLWTRLCFLEDARTTNFWRRPEPDNFVMANPTPLLQEHFSKRLTGSQRKRSCPWRRNLPKAQKPANQALSLIMKTPGQLHTLRKMLPQRDLQQPRAPLSTDW